MAKNSLKLLPFLILFFILVDGQTFAYVASSTNYRLEVDSVNFGGGLSTSTNYNLEDTAGEIGSGDLSGTNYDLSAGYQAMLTDTFVSVSEPSDITLSGTITTASGGEATGSSAWKITTNSSGGYTLSILASTDPALQSGANSFDDYTPAGAAPDYDWTVASADSAFGFSPEGGDVVTRFKNNGSSCNQAGGSVTSGYCWDGFSTSNTSIASASSGNNPTGATTTVNLKAEAGSSASQATGSYSATITITALAQ